MKLTHTLFAISAAILLITLGLAYIKLVEHDALIILHFDSYRGIDFFGSRADVFNIIFIGIGIGLLNYLLARVTAKRDELLPKLLAGASAFFSLLIFIAVAVIISIN